MNPDLFAKLRDPKLLPPGSQDQESVDNKSVTAATESMEIFVIILTFLSETDQRNQSGSIALANDFLPNEPDRITPESQKPGGKLGFAIAKSQNSIPA